MAKAGWIGITEQLLLRPKAYLTDEEARLSLLDIGLRLYQKGWAAANDGNISCLAGPKALWITPAGISKGYMTEEMLVKVDLAGQVLAGKFLPSSELAMHLRVYRENPALRAIVHAHCPVATAFAVAGKALDQPILAEAVAMLGPVPVASFAQPGTMDLGDMVAPFCHSHKAVLLANHGVLTWGETPAEAYYRLERTEYYATLLMHTGHLPAPARYLET